MENFTFQLYGSTDRAEILVKCLDKPSKSILVTHPALGRIASLALAEEICKKLNNYAAIEQALLKALPYVEDAETDPVFKPGVAKRDAKMIKDLLNKV